MCGRRLDGRRFSGANAGGLTLAQGVSSLSGKWRCGMLLTVMLFAFVDGILIGLGASDGGAS